MPFDVRNPTGHALHTSVVIGGVVRPVTFASGQSMRVDDLTAHAKNLVGRRELTSREIPAYTPSVSPVVTTPVSPSIPTAFPPVKTATSTPQVFPPAPKTQRSPSKPAAAVKKAE